MAKRIALQEPSPEDIFRLYREIIAEEEMATLHFVTYCLIRTVTNTETAGNVQFVRVSFRKIKSHKDYDSGLIGEFGRLFEVAAFFVNIFHHQYKASLQEIRLSYGTLPRRDCCRYGDL